MRFKVLVSVLAVAVLASVVTAQAGLHVGVKVWHQNMELGDSDFTLEASGVTFGPTVSLDLSPSTWVSASWLFGTMEWDDSGGLEYDTQDAEAVLAVSFDWLDVGVGVRYSQVEFLDGLSDPVRSYGPLAYVGMGTPLGDTPFGWYVAGSIMPIDLNDDFGDDDEGAHFNVEGGLSVFLEPITGTVGYRYKDYYNIDDVDFTFQGVVGSVGIVF